MIGKAYLKFFTFYSSSNSDLESNVWSQFVNSQKNHSKNLVNLFKGLKEQGIELDPFEKLDKIPED